MKKPVKDYEIMYPEKEKNLNEQNAQFYMCEYIDAWVKKPVADIEIDAER